MCLCVCVCVWLLNPGLRCCKDSDTELIQKLQRLKLESLVRTGAENTRDEALDTLTQVQH